MKAVVTIIRQMGIMYILMFIGFIVYRKKIIDEKGSRQMANLLVWVINPLVMLMSYQMEFSMEKLKQLGISFALSLVSMIIGIIIAEIIFKDNGNIDKLAVSFANGGFIGIPLVTNILGAENVFFLSAYFVCFWVLNYTYGIYRISEDKSLVSLKKILGNPGIIAIIVGFLIFISPVKLPKIVYDAFNFIGNTNTPIAMIVLGTYIAESGLTTLFTNKRTYFICFIKLIVIPLIMVGIYKLLPSSLNDIKKVLLIAMSAPVAVTVSMFSQIYGKDYKYAAQLVGLSTLLSLVTIPLIMHIADIVW
ncbi:AEC family transporter [Acidilutibacter cellobiosedens]|jgi:hypothetical protein|uniref:AEC family transporter n=1 Tax=Acidilutibacter cellobiosedens TaxID=2507161 RepID=A0A410QAZ7_9FIRM|nr:AEC family transporter [Acidilutibacter cellobiosedens]MBE6082273.1 AEC family transporter [Tissierellaceae bacterium]QAT61048.1 AEC family transporter [Acidilutibacter cellobiosedens]